MPERSRTYSWADPYALALAGRERPALDLFQDVIGGSLPPPPIAQTLGFELVEAEPGRVVFRFEPAEWHYNPIGSVHGGLACTLADSAMACAVHTRLPAGVGYSSMDVQVRFTRPITVDTGPVYAIGETMTVGRRTATARAELRDGQERLLAYATTSCLVFPLNGGGSPS